MCDNEARWVKDEDTGAWYYYYDDGSMAYDTMVHGYYVNADGQWTLDEGSREIIDDNGDHFYYYIGHNGKAVTGWNKIGDDFHYYNYPDGSMTHDNTIDGFDIDSYGNIDSGTGWLKDEYSGNWYYFSDGQMKTGWIQVGDKWYYLKDDGTMATGWFQDEKGDWYYLHSDGSMATGWEQEDNGDWYFLKSDGAMAHDTTVDGYYLNDKGEWVPNVDDADLSEADSEKTADENNDKLKILWTTVDINKFTHDGKKRIEYLFMQLDSIEERHGLYDTLGIYKYKDYDEAINDTWDEIDDIIADESTYDTKDIAEDERRLDSIGSGALQAFGGYTETILGGTTVVTGYVTVDPLAILGGTYLGVDGTSNFSGGVSKVKNAIWENNEGDTWNFMKNEYIKMSPKYGENIYNVTQVVAGFYSLNKDLSAIPSDVVKVYPRTKNIIRAENEGLEASTSVLDIGNKVVITTKTESGMILTRTVIDKAEDISTIDKATIGADAYNTESSAESIK